MPISWLTLQNGTTSLIMYAMYKLYHTNMYIIILCIHLCRHLPCSVVNFWSYNSVVVLCLIDNGMIGKECEISEVLSICATDNTCIQAIKRSKSNLSSAFSSSIVFLLTDSHLLLATSISSLSRYVLDILWTLLIFPSLARSVEFGLLSYFSTCNCSSLYMWISNHPCNYYILKFEQTTLYILHTS